jgi:hypothetical protein
MLIASRLPLLELVLVAWAVWHAVAGAWVGDFFEHAAVVRELAAHPLHPGHPQLPLDAPHPFYSPYAWLLGLAARATGAGPLAVLPVAGVVNLGLLLVGLRRFVALWAPSGREEAATFYTVVFLLLLWGSGWGFSGFFHLGVFGVVLPYPSTFAAGLSLLALRLHADTLRRPPGAAAHLPRVALMVVVSAVLLTHPLTFLFLVCGLGGVTVAFASRFVRETATLAGIGLAGVAVATLWPLYPFLDLVTSGTAGFHEPNRGMYEAVLSRVGLAWLGAPVLLVRLRRNPRDGLALTAFALGALYVLGGLTERWSYGRVIAYVALCLQIALAVAMAGLEGRLAASRGRPELVRAAVAAAVGLLLVVAGWSGLVRPALARLRPDADTTLMQLSFLEEQVRQGDVVLADLRVAGVPPALAGKVVASNRPQPFVPGHAQRQADVARFFGPGTAAEERLAILRRYEPRFVLRFERDEEVAAALVASLGGEMHVVHRDERYLLLEADASPGAGRSPGSASVESRR